MAKKELREYIAAECLYAWVAYGRVILSTVFDGAVNRFKDADINEVIDIAIEESAKLENT